MEIVNESLDEWLSTLKPFQRNTIKVLLQNNDGNEEKVAELWLNSFGPINTATYGGVPTSASDKNYFKSLKSELNKLICGDKDYVEEKKQILDGGHLLNVAASAKIASLLAPVIGVSFTVLAPAIVLMLHVISKVSVNAYCDMVR